MLTQAAAVSRLRAAAAASSHTHVGMDLPGWQQPAWCCYAVKGMCCPGLHLTSGGKTSGAQTGGHSWEYERAGFMLDAYTGAVQDHSWLPGRFRHVANHPLDSRVCKNAQLRTTPLLRNVHALAVAYSGCKQHVYSSCALTQRGCYPWMQPPQCNRDRWTRPHQAAQLGSPAMTSRPVADPHTPASMWPWFHCTAAATASPHTPAVPAPMPVLAPTCVHTLCRHVPSRSCIWYSQDGHPAPGHTHSAPGHTHMWAPPGPPIPMPGHLAQSATLESDTLHAPTSPATLVPCVSWSPPLAPCTRTETGDLHGPGQH